MPCLACGGPDGPVCPACSARLHRAPARSLGDGVVASAVWSHAGTGRRLVQRLKYEGVVAVVSLATAEAFGAPPGARAVVPIPRVLARRVAYGIDPARVLAGALGRSWGLPVVDVLRAPMWARRRAGRAQRPGPPALRADRRVAGAVVVDDVITSGATARLAAGLVGARHAVALTMAKSPGVVGVVNTMADEHHL